MIIRIEDAPNIKNLKIDISFDEDGNAEQNVVINSDTSDISDVMPKKQKTPSFIDEELNLDEDFSVSDEKVELPVIPETIERDVKVSDDMTDAEF